LGFYLIYEHTPTAPTSVLTSAVGLGPPQSLWLVMTHVNYHTYIQADSTEMKLKLLILKIRSTTLLPGGSDRKNNLTVNSFGVDLGTDAHSHGKTYVWDYDVVFLHK
jgi:hypothetical protein